MRHAMAIKLSLPYRHTPQRRGSSSCPAPLCGPPSRFDWPSTWPRLTVCNDCRILNDCRPNKEVRIEGEGAGYTHVTWGNQATYPAKVPSTIVSIGISISFSMLKLNLKLRLRLKEIFREQLKVLLGTRNSNNPSLSESSAVNVTAAASCVLLSAWRSNSDKAAETSLSRLRCWCWRWCRCRCCWRCWLCGLWRPMQLACAKHPSNLLVLGSPVCPSLSLSVCLSILLCYIFVSCFVSRRVAVENMRLFKI